MIALALALTSAAPMLTAQAVQTPAAPRTATPRRGKLEILQVFGGVSSHEFPEPFHETLRVQGGRGCACVKQVGCSYG